jgi:hypothetical protein
MTPPELVLTASEMKQADLEAIAGGIPGIELMRRAGCAVADSAEKLVSQGGRIVIAAGQARTEATASLRPVFLPSEAIGSASDSWEP